MAEAESSDFQTPNPMTWSWLYMPGASLSQKTLRFPFLIGLVAGQHENGTPLFRMVKTLWFSADFPWNQSNELINSAGGGSRDCGGRWSGAFCGDVSASTWCFRIGGYLIFMVDTGKMIYHMIYIYSILEELNVLVFFFFFWLLVLMIVLQYVIIVLL